MEKSIVWDVSVPVRTAELESLWLLTRTVTTAASATWLLCSANQKKSSWSRRKFNYVFESINKLIAWKLSWFFFVLNKEYIFNTIFIQGKCNNYFMNHDILQINYHGHNLQSEVYILRYKFTGPIFRLLNINVSISVASSILLEVGFPAPCPAFL